MTKNQIKSLISTYLSKQAEESPMHEGAESAGAEALEHAGGMEGGAAPGDLNVEEILSQLSPEELQELLAQLANEHPESMPGNDEIGGLSQGIESSLAANPEASVPGLPPEKAAALNFVKSAHYIEGFIKQALDYGLNASQAVHAYDDALTSTVYQLKEAALTDAGRTAMKGLDASRKSQTLKERIQEAYTKATGHASDAYSKVKEHASDAYDKAMNSSIGKKIKDNPITSAGVAGLGVGGLGGYAASKSSDKEKEAAFLEGVYKQALARGFSEDDAVEITKEAALTDAGKKTLQALDASRKSPKLKERVYKTYTKAKEHASDAYSKVKGRASDAYDKAMNSSIAKKIKDNPKTSAGIAAGAAALGAGGAYAASKSSDKEKEKKSAFLEGVYKQALARGFSEDDAVEITKEAAGKLKEMTESAKAKVKGLYGAAKEKATKAYGSAKDKAEGAWNKGMNKVYTNPGKSLAGAGAAIAASSGAGYLAGKRSKEKEAAFLEGVYKQALARGFSEQEALEVISNLNQNID